MKFFKTTALSLLILSLFACNTQNNQVLTTSVNNATINSINSDSSQKDTYLKQIEAVMKQFPETQKVFTDWKPDNAESLKIQQEVASRVKTSKNINIPEENLNKILSQKAVITTESFKPVNFSLDQGAHINKMTEWWYYNGHLTSAEGKKYGYELCFFRATPVIYFAHVALTDENNQKFSFERKFYSPTKIKTKNKTSDIAYDKQTVQQTGDFSYKLHGEINNLKFDFNLNMEKGPLLINGNGIIDMPEGTNSYYYSLTKLKTEGTITDNGKSIPVTGQSWVDHQWGNFVALRVGWDWFSFQMDDSTEYNLFSFRNGKDKTLKQFVNVMDSRNKGSNSLSFDIKRLDWWQSPTTSDLYVNKWQITLPQRKETFIVEANVANQELFSSKVYDIAPGYWEGSCKVTKKLANGREISGLAYVEHFPYQSKID